MYFSFCVSPSETRYFAHADSVIWLRKFSARMTRTRELHTTLCGVCSTKDGGIVLGQHRNKAFPLLQRIVHALLLLSVAASLPRCTATVKNYRVTTPKLETLVDAASGPLVTLTGCFPGILFYETNLPYYCEVANADALAEMDLRVSYYAGRLNVGWPATLEMETGVVSFVPDRGGSSGSIDLLITRLSPFSDDAYIPVSTNLTMEFISTWSTYAVFTTSDAYYGMTLKLTTNIREVYSAVQYLLVGSREKCQYTTTNCSADAGCHNVTAPAQFPEAGEYHLCVTAFGWRNHHLPWGNSLLQVKMLVSLPLYLVNGSRTVIALEDAAVGTGVGGMMQTFLVACPDSVCARVTLSDTDETAVRLDVCVGSPESQRVYPSIDGVLAAMPGVYAVCASRGEESGVSPAALPVTVLEKPFAFNIVSETSTSVTIHVSGGDLTWRNDPYVVCALPTGVSCDSPLAGLHLCVPSTTAQEPSVTIDLDGSGLTVDSARFCFVAANMTFLGRTHTWVMEAVNVTSETSGDGAVAPVKRFAVDIFILIMVGVVLVAVILALIVACLLCCRQGRKKVTYDEENVPHAKPIAAVNPLGAHGGGASPSKENTLRNSAVVGPSSGSLDGSKHCCFTFLAQVGEYMMVHRLIKHLERMDPSSGGISETLETASAHGSSPPLREDRLFGNVPEDRHLHVNDFINEFGRLCLAFGVCPTPLEKGRWLHITLWIKYGASVELRRVVETMKEVLLPPDFVPDSRSATFNTSVPENNASPSATAHSLPIPVTMDVGSGGSVECSGITQRQAFSLSHSTPHCPSEASFEERWITNPLNPMHHNVVSNSFSAVFLHPSRSLARGAAFSSVEGGSEGSSEEWLCDDLDE